MTDIHIDEVQTNIEITESVGTLGPAELKKIVSLVMAQLNMQKHHEDLRHQDDRLQNSAYVPDLNA